VADASASFSGDITYLDIPGPINELETLTGALENGLLSSGFLQSLSDSFEYALHGVF